jgi:peptide/nickel transport system ATP-binding protein
MTADRILTVEDLKVGYFSAPGEVRPAVNGVSFTLAKGESLGIVGESGCGKSTLARALLGYCRPGSMRLGGRVVLDRHDLFGMPPAAVRALRGRKVALVPQNPLSSLTYHIRVGPQVAEVLRIHQGLDNTAARKAAIDLMAATNLPEPERLYGNYPHQLSGGQRQRVVIAAALACRPDVMVLDEPTTALDTTTEMQVVNLVKGLRAQIGMALVYVTHDLTLTAYMCDRVLVMLSGRIVEEGPVNQVFHRPRSDYARALIAAIPRLDGPPSEKAPVPTRPVPSASAPLLRVSGLRHAFGRRLPIPFLGCGTGGIEVVRDVSFALAAGETLGLVGESGSGKSTIANIIAGLIAPTAGEIAFEGAALAGRARERSADLRRRIQIVFQDPLSSLNPRHRVATILTRPISIFHGLEGRAARRRAVELLEAMELAPELMERFPRQLSGGQQQRVAIARAFAARPDLIICDEITSALDVSVQAHVLRVLKAVQNASGAACLFISHNLGVVREICDQVVILKNGTIQEAGATDAIFARPTHPYTRHLLAAAARDGEIATLVPNPMAQAPLHHSLERLTP